MASVGVEDVVTATYHSLDGRSVSLTFKRNETLGGMQRALCAAFSKSFPKMRAGLLTGDRLSYDDFRARPLLCVKDGDGSWDFSVVFAITTDMRLVDKCFPRLAKATSFEEDMQSVSDA